MFVIVGIVIVFGSILFGYTMRHGQIGVLMQWSEFIIIGGAAIGAFLISNPMSVVTASVKQVVGLFKANPYNEKAYAELLQVLYNVFQKARKDGLVGLESHIEDPHSSDIFQKYPFFMHNHHALPGFGIVAAVLGVVITMGSIGGTATEIGEKVAAALVGTFLGILLSYGLVNPIAAAIEGRQRAEHDYMSCIRTALLAFARGDSPMTCVEFARRNIEPVERPTFAELEALTRRAA